MADLKSKLLRLLHLALLRRKPLSKGALFLVSLRVVWGTNHGTGITLGKVEKFRVSSKCNVVTKITRASQGGTGKGTELTLAT